MHKRVHQLRECCIVAFAMSLVLFSHFWAAPAQAESDKSVFVKQSKEALQRYEAEISRCGLEAPHLNFSGNLYVVSSQRPTTRLQLGDHVLSIAGKPVSTFEMMRAILVTVPPDAVIQVEVWRRDQTIQLDVQCGDVKPTYVALADISRAAANKKFESCIEKANQYDRQFGRDSHSAHTAYLCAFHGGRLKNPNNNAAEFYQFLRIAIEEAKWDPSEFAETRGWVISNRQWFADTGQAALYAELERQLAVAEASVTTQPARSAETPNDRVVGSSGTCFFVSPDGKAITSYHVVAGATKIVLAGRTGDRIEAQVVASSEATDLAVLQATVRPPRYLSLAPMRSASVGMKVFTYGYPVSDLLGAEPKFTDGTVSALSGIGGEQTFLQVSVPVQPGNSGGPLVNEQGEVVGVIAAQAAIAPFLRGTGTLPQNINWAVKAEYASLLTPLPPPQVTASSREKAIQLVRDAICYVEAN